MSWYPLGHGDKSLIQEPVFAELGKKYGKTPAQVILRWHIQMGFVVIPGSKNVEHIRDNLAIMDFALTADEMAKIAMLDKGERYYHRTDEQLIQFAAWKPDFEKKISEGLPVRPTSWRQTEKTDNIFCNTRACAFCLHGSGIKRKTDNDILGTKMPIPEKSNLSQQERQNLPRLSALAYRNTLL